MPVGKARCCQTPLHSPPSHRSSHLQWAWQTLCAELVLEMGICLSQGCAAFRALPHCWVGTSGFRSPGRGRGDCRIYGRTWSNTWHSHFLCLVKRLWGEGEMTRYPSPCSYWNPDKGSVDFCKTELGFRVFISEEFFFSYPPSVQLPFVSWL